MRAGTSKGLYLHRHDLPTRQEDWSPIIARAMGSYDSDPRQLNGIGGATSTTSKVAIISRSKRPDADIDYTFVQVPIGSSKLDFTGNCGNIASGVGPFAVDEGLVDIPEGQRQVQVRVFNTNTKSILVETLEVDDSGHFLEAGDCTIPGLSSKGSRVSMAFEKPAGAMTGKLLPSGNASDILLVQTTLTSAPLPVRVSAVDAANPFLLVDSSTLLPSYHEDGPHSQRSLALIERIRRQGAILMGLAKTEDEAALTRGTPKIAVLSPALPAHGTSEGRIQVTAFSMGKVHGSLQLTGAVCLGAAACTPGTVAHSIRHGLDRTSDVSVLKRTDSGQGEAFGSTQCVPLRHPGGDMDVDVRLSLDGSVHDVTVFRTARRLFEGRVYYLM